MQKSCRVVGGKYRLETLLGAGGMGEVWKAAHLELETTVAVKLLSKELVSETNALRLRHEARAAARLRSPHVVQVFDFGVEDELPYIVMELLEGETLKERLEKAPRAGIPLALLVAEHTALALELAHAQGIIHRDIKPSNLLLTRAGDDELVKVLDFGIAKMGATTEAGVTLPGSVVGSPGFMSPEQANGEHVDGRSDLWSLGAVLFRLLTGAAPFPGVNLAEIRASVNRGVPRATELCPDLPPKLDAFFGRALALLPADRFQSAREFALSFRTATGILTGTSVVPLAYTNELAREATTCSLVVPQERPEVAQSRRTARVMGGLAVAASVVALLGALARTEGRTVPAASNPLPRARTEPRGVPSAAPPSVIVQPASALASPPRSVPEPALPRPAPRRKSAPPAARPEAPTPVAPSATTDPLFGLSASAPGGSSRRSGDPE